MANNDLVEQLIIDLNTYAKQQLDRFFHEQVNKKGNTILNHFSQSDLEFSAKIFRRVRNRVTELDLRDFYNHPKRRHRLPLFILTSTDTTDGAKIYAMKKGILVLTYRDLAQHLRLLELPPAAWRNYRIHFLY